MSRLDTIPTQAPAEDRSTQFVAVEGGQETTSAEALLVAAYIAMWALLLLFVFLSWRRLGGLERRLAALSRSAGGKGSGPTGE